MGDRSPTAAPDAPPLTGRALEIVRWLLAHADEVNATPNCELAFHWGTGGPKYRFIRSGTVALPSDAAGQAED